MPQERLSRNYFNFIGKQDSVEYRSEVDPKETPIQTDSQLNELFNSVSLPGKFWSFVLDGCVLYINAIEHSANAMEMSTVSAKNAVL